MQKIFDIIDKNESKYVDFLVDVCNIESPTSLKEGVDKAGQYFIDRAKNLGFEVEIFEHNVSGNVVCITMNSNATKPMVVLSGHLDTVHPVGLFGTPPTKVDAQNVYGPGVKDCKGGCVLAFCAMEELFKAGYKDRPVRLILQSDEETSSRGSNKETVKYMVEKSLGALAFINLEGGRDGYITTQRKGILRQTFEVEGISCHSSICSAGASAITECAHKIIELEKYKDSQSITCNCGLISGGTTPNTVPHFCSFLADFRFANKQEYEEILKIIDTVASTSYVSGCRCTTKRVSYRPPMERTQKTMDLFDKINAIFIKNGFGYHQSNMSFGGSDAAYMVEAGIPSVDNLGIWGARIHSKDEYAEIKSISTMIKKLACLIVELE